MLRVTGAWANSDYTALVLSAGGHGELQQHLSEQITNECNAGRVCWWDLPKDMPCMGNVKFFFFFAHIRRHAMLFVWYVLRNPVSCRCRKSYGQWHACLLFQALKRKNPVLSLRRQRPSVSSRPEGSLRIFHWGQLLIVDAFKVSDDRALNPGSDSSPVPKIG